jgi:hypothetical protein
MQNPNRFIRGLSDISDIVDIPCNDGPEVIHKTTVIPLVVPSPAPSTVTSIASLTQFEQTLTIDGAQILSIGETPGSNSMLFINGFIQSKTSYDTSGDSLILPSSLNLFAGDLIIFLYLK